MIRAFRLRSENWPSSERKPRALEITGDAPNLDASLAQPEFPPERCPSFDLAYEQHFTFVWRCLRSLGVPLAQLDDAAQEVFLVVYRRLDSFGGSLSFRAWLFAIVRRVASNQRRTIKRKTGRVEPLDNNLRSVAAGPHESAEASEVAAFLERFLDTLDEKKREVFALAVIEELSVSEVSEALGIPLNTTYTRLRRARADFRRALEERSTHHDPYRI
jgi:RNA polymerase sigma-70 factor, ECF subfamily